MGGRAVHCLICHRDIETGIICLGSLLKYSVVPLHLVLHDDGSLTQADAERLTTALKGAEIILRPSVDAMINDSLSRYPRCREYRRRYAYALKLFDVPHLSQMDIAYCDSDILFGRPFSGLFQWPEEPVSALVSQDFRSSYAFEIGNLFHLYDTRLLSHVNAGVFLAKKEIHDLDYVEWFLGRDYLKWDKRWFYVEQTCWAALFCRTRCRMYNPLQVTVMRPGLKLSDDVVAIHFTSIVRSHLASFASRGGLNSAEATRITTIPSSKLDIVEWLRLAALKCAKPFRKVDTTLPETWPGRR
jgi:hypothetical protein